MNTTASQTPCSHRERTVRVEDLPVCCPPRDESLWNAHPRVYLAPNEQGEVVCPYCSTRYRLAGD